jgi:hypothetical protein
MNITSRMYKNWHITQEGIVFNTEEMRSSYKKWTNPNWGIDYSLNVWNIAQKD